VAGARIRTLTDGDIERAIALTDLEGWGYTRADFARLLALHPGGCFAAEEGGKVVGMLSTTVYGRLAFLGTVIVDPSRRGGGIGDAMMRAALDHLDGLGVETVRLNAYLHVVPFYERLGFRKEYENVRWQGPPPQTKASVARPVAASDLSRLIEFDARFFGASRARLLELLRQEFGRTFLVRERDGDLFGFVVGNTSSADCEVGPWIVHPTHRDGARDLFDGLVSAAGGRSYALTAPVVNHASGDFMRELGYREVFRTLRMVRGRTAFDGAPRGVWALAGLEKG